MKIFVAGATGVLGRELVPRLVARGHEVVGMTRTPSKQDGLRALGARPVVADALDPETLALQVERLEAETGQKPLVLSSATRQGVTEALRTLMARMDAAAAEAPVERVAWQP